MDSRRRGLDIRGVTYGGRQPTFTLAFAAVLLASVASSIASIAYSQTIVSTSLGAVVLSPLNTARAAIDAPRVVQWVLAAAVVLYGLGLLIRAAVARWVIQTYGSAVTFGRAVAAFVIADVWGIFLTGVVVSTLSHASGPAHSTLGLTGFAASALVLFPLGFTGLVASALVLSSSSTARSTGESQGTRYIHPPNAPSDWP
jgi:hypothetical protein